MIVPTLALASPVILNGFVFSPDPELVIVIFAFNTIVGLTP